MASPPHQPKPRVQNPTTPTVVWGMDDMCVCALAQLLPEIVSFSIRNVGTSSDGINYDVLTLIACWKDLRKLSLVNFSPPMLGAGVGWAINPNEASVDSSAVEKTRKKAIEGMGGVLKTIAQYCTRLRQLDFTRSSLSDNVIVSLAHHLPLLTHVKLNQCFGISSHALASLARCQDLINVGLAQSLVGFSTTNILVTHCKHLRDLDFAGCTGITDACLTVISENLPDLLTANLRNCLNLSDVGTVALVNKCRKLKSINLDGVMITDLTLTAIGSCTPDLLDLWISGHPSFHSISASALQCVGNGCLYLSHLSLRCVHITAEAFEKFQSILDLELYNCKIQNQSILSPLNPTQRELIEAPPLRRFVLHGCALADVSARNIVEIVKDLRSFTLSDSFVSGNGLRTLIKSMTNLYALELVSENKKFHITETVTSLLTKTSPNLHTLTLAGNMSGEVVVSLICGLPNLRKLTLRLYNRKREQMLSIAESIRSLQRNDLVWEVYGGFA
eukprot:c3548_g1_i1.p1 GENE.c3548_g1_i1~~c3548_g1_i1.p1  ORF type:complete len:528 (-),score=104.87 c3548_g1_i1:24-1532(-)